jgi:uncharacterized protein
MSEVYAIVDLQGYASEMREAAAKSLSDNYNENLDDFISINQMINLVKNECVGFDNKDRPLLNENTNEKIYESTVTWIHNVGLAKLAAKNLIECAWDNQTNEMIFWANKEINKISKPKRKSNDKSSKPRNKKKDQGS